MATRPLESPYARAKMAERGDGKKGLDGQRRKVELSELDLLVGDVLYFNSRVSHDECSGPPLLTHFLSSPLPVAASCPLPRGTIRVQCCFCVVLLRTTLCGNQVAFVTLHSSLRLLRHLVCLSRYVRM